MNDLPANSDAAEHEAGVQRTLLERQAFLLKLSDSLRWLADPAKVIAVASETTGRYLGVGRAGYGEVDANNEWFVVVHDWTDGVMRNMAGKHRVADFGPASVAAHRSDRAFIVEDALNDPRFADHQAAFKAIGLVASLLVPLVKDGRWIAGFYAQQSFPRRWTPDDENLIRDVVERTWAAVERARAEAALRTSESRLRAMFDSVDQGYLEVEVTMSPDGRAVDWRYVAVNPSFERLTGMKDVTGRLVSEVAPDLEPEWAERYAQVVTSGEPMRFELPAAALGRWFDVNLVNIGGAGSRRIACVYDDVTERKRAELALRESKEHQTFLLELSDALRAEPSAEAVANRALRMLFAQMGLDRCYIGIYRLKEDSGEFPFQVHDDRLSPLPAEIRLSDFPGGLQVVFNRRLVIDNVAEKEGLSDGDRANIEGLGLRALVNAIVRKGENNPLWAIVAGSMHPRAWTQGEVSLVEEVAERTWAAVERARAEAARVTADERFTRLFEVSPAPLLVIAPDPAQFTISEVNEAYLAATMRTREELIGRPLFDAFPDNPNEPTSAGVSNLRASLERVLSSRQPDKMSDLKYDIARSDGTFEERWWSPVNSPILDNNGEVEAIIHNANDVTAERRSEQYQGLLLAELQHRVRNTLTIVRSVARRTAVNSKDINDYVRHLDGRLAALARVQTILTRDPGQGVDLHDMVADELRSQAALPVHFQIEGPKIELSAKAAEVLSLAIHELTTNSAKYGVLSKSSGAIQIRWVVDDRDGQAWLRWSWHEPVGSKIDRPARTGFGTELIVGRVPYELRGAGHLLIGDEAVEARIDFPLANELRKPEIVSTDRDKRQ